MFQENLNKYESRACGSYRTPFFRTDYAQRSISYRGPQVWNILIKCDKMNCDKNKCEINCDKHKEIVNKDTYQSFKLIVKQKLLNKSITPEFIY